MKIEDRVRKLEEEDAWRKSKTKRNILTVLTYVSVLSFLLILDVESPYIKAAVPTIAYVISALSLPKIKEYWINNSYKKRK